MKRSIIRSTIFNILFYSTTLIACAVMLPALVLPRKHFLSIAQGWIYLTMFLERNILKLYFEVRGAENLPKDGGAFIIAAKHQSAYETFKLRLLFDDPAIILKRELLRIPLWGWYLKKSGVIAIDRSNAKTALRSLTRGAVQMKKAGRPIVIFPQGTRVGPDESAKDKPYKAGIHRIQAATDLPIIPMALNSGLFWPRNGWLKSSGTVVFEFLKPIKAGKDNKELNAYLEKKIETASQALMNEARAYSDALPPRNIRTMIIALNVAVLLFVGYSLYWFKSAEKISEHYIEFITDIAPSGVVPAPPEITGYPWKMRMSVPTQSIAFTGGHVEITDFTLSGWPFPAAVSHVQTGELAVYYHEWQKPMRFDYLSADLKYRRDVLHITKSSLRREDMNAEVKGSADFNQKPFPQLDLMATLWGHKTLLRNLARAGAIEVKAALFVGAGLSAMADDEGKLKIPIHQKDGQLYAGPIKMFKIKTQE